ncbi:MAG: RNA polymerase sigma factor [Thiotrichales bacterium]|nr:MAG: RNA polymerase sigma factor [Thiotrichales bacterium]
MSEQTLFDRAVLQKLYRYACTLCQDGDDAYDLLQYALEKFLQQAGAPERRNELAFVRTIMRNRFIDQYRHSNRFPQESYDDTTMLVLDEGSLEDMVIAQADLEIVWQLLDPFEREILYYWAVEEMTAQEISHQIDVPRGTVLSRIYRVRKKIESKTGTGNMSGGYLT